MGLFEKIFGKRNNTEEKESHIHNKGIVRIEKLQITADTLNSLSERYIAFDVETTGLSVYSDRIIELGAVIFEKGEIAGRYGTLVNPEKNISAEATRINHITNDMLRTAPTEEQAYPFLVSFLGDAIQANTIICAHNAQFDMSFLRETLIRLGINGTIRYVDTLSLSRQHLKLSSYKQESVASFYGIVNQNAHRAVTDAEVCGKILWELLKTERKELEKKEIKKKEREPSEEELEVCAMIQDMVLKNGGNNAWLRFYKNSSGYVTTNDFYSVLKFKFAKKGRYVIVPADLSCPDTYPTEKCSVSEGGTNYMRVYFSSPFDFDFLSDYIITRFKEAEIARELYFREVQGARRDVEQSIADMTALSDADVKRLIEQARNKNYNASSVHFDDNQTISRADVVVNAVHNRCPIWKIKNRGNSDKGFELGFPYYEQGESLRKSGDIERAISLYDKARAVGYDAPALYEAYAKAYRKLADYDNEIVIIEEFMERNPDVKYGRLEARRNKAIELLFDNQQIEKKKSEKAIKKENQKQEKEIETVPLHTDYRANRGRSIIQMDDEANVIREYETVTIASKETGINPKSIRDAAKGIQKHAGGFVWKFKNE